MAWIGAIQDGQWLTWNLLFRWTVLFSSLSFWLFLKFPDNVWTQSILNVFQPVHGFFYMDLCHTVLAMDPRGWEEEPIRHHDRDELLELAHKYTWPFSSSMNWGDLSKNHTGGPFPFLFLGIDPCWGPLMGFPPTLRTYSPCICGNWGRIYLRREPYAPQDEPWI